MNLLDNHSKLLKIKRQYSIRSKSHAPSAFIAQKQFQKRLEPLIIEHFRENKFITVCNQQFNREKIYQNFFFKLLKFSVAELTTAEAVLDKDGFIPCLEYIRTKKKKVKRA